MDSHIDLRIREATVNDVPIILHLIRELAKYEKLSQEVFATEELLRKNGFGKQPYFHTLLAEIKKGSQYLPVGFALYFFTFSTFVGKPTLYLEDLFVEPAYRGKGIGKTFLKTLARIAIHKDCGRMEWAVLDWNQPAIRFYESIGAIPLKEWTVYRMNRKTLENFVNQ